MKACESLRMQLKYNQGPCSEFASTASISFFSNPSGDSLPARLGSKIDAAAHASEMSVRNGHCMSVKDVLTSTAIVPSFIRAMVACNADKSIRVVGS